MMATRRKRDARYPFKQSVVLRAETGATLEQAADRYEVAIGTLIRDAVERGIGPALKARALRETAAKTDA